MTTLRGLLYPIFFLLVFLLAKEYVLVNADLVVIGAFFLVFFLLKKQLTPSLLETFRDRRLSIRQALARYSLRLLQSQFFIRRNRASFLTFIEFSQEHYLTALGQEFLAYQQEKLWFLLLLQANEEKEEINKH